MKIVDLINDSMVNSIPIFGIKKPQTRTIALSENMLINLQDICKNEKINGARYLIENVMKVFVDNYNNWNLTRND